MQREYDAEYLEEYTGRFKRVFDSPLSLNRQIEFSNFGAKSRFITVTQRREDGRLSVQFEGKSLSQKSVAQRQPAGAARMGATSWKEAAHAASTSESGARLAATADTR